MTNTSIIKDLTTQYPVKKWLFSNLKIYFFSIKKKDVLRQEKKTQKISLKRAGLRIQ
jgi:hypothetical protein